MTCWRGFRWFSHGWRNTGKALMVFSLLAGLLCSTVCAAVDEAAERRAKEVETQQKLAKVREEIAALTRAQQVLDTERNEAAQSLREADQYVNQESHTLREIEAEIQEQENALTRLNEERQALEVRLSSQREALAQLIRSAYALGRHEQLKLLLAQDRIEALARIMAYHRYFQKDRVVRIDHLLDELKELADVVQQIQVQRTALDARRETQQQQLATLEARRDERRAIVAALDARFKDTESKIKALGRDEQALASLLERLQDIFADIPDKLPVMQALSQQRGRLILPVNGSVSVAFAGKLPDGRTSQGWLMPADAGTPVRAIAHGRVAFSDWLKGYGLLVILDHGDGYMSLYAFNDSVQREVGEWVNAGDVLSSVGSSGGQSMNALYFELRRAGRPLDPKGWFASR